MTATRQQEEPAMTLTPVTLAVFDDVDYCSAGHGVRLVTTGDRGYAEGTSSPSVPVPCLDRVLTVISGECSQPVRGGEPCRQEVRWDLATDGAWAAATDTHRHMLTDAVKVER